MKSVSFSELCSFLKATKVKTIYLIHEPYREEEAREIAIKLGNQGFIALVAQDYRRRGKHAVVKAIEKSDWTLVLAYDDETVQKCINSGVAVYDLRKK